MAKQEEVVSRAGPKKGRCRPPNGRAPAKCDPGQDTPAGSTPPGRNQRGCNPSEPIIWQMPGTDHQLEPHEAKDWMESNDKRLKPHVVTVRKTWRKHALPTHRFPTECSPRAISFLRQSPHLPSAVYVLGETIGGGRNQHGWVEIDDCVVFDGVMQQFYDKSGYYAAEFAAPWYRFIRPAVMYLHRMMKKDQSMTYRWDCVLRLPYADTSLPPMLIDLERSVRGVQDRSARLVLSQPTV